MPNPAGNIIKAIADTGVNIIDILESVENNVEDAQELGGYIASLVQAILQFLPAEQPSPLSQQIPNTSQEIDFKEVELSNALNGFLQTLQTVGNDLKNLSEQGRFRKVLLVKSNQTDLKGFNQSIQRAFNRLQIQLQLRMLRSIDGIESANLEQQRRWLLDRLNGSDNGAQEKAADQSDLLCHSGTRIEVLQDIYDWINDSPAIRFLWLNGVAGCGKTSVAATVHHHLQSLSVTSAIFYCTAGNQTRCASVVCSLALWLARSSHGSLERFILEAIHGEQDISSLPLSRQIELLLEKPMSVVLPDARPVVLIIDALDEWYDTKKASSLVTLLANMRSSTNVKILVTSRDDKHVKLAFSKAARDAVRKLELDAVHPQLVERDLEAYLTTHLAELHKYHSLAPDWPGPRRLRALIDKSEHLFQFAATALRYIQLGYPPVSLNEVLDGPTSSETLKDLYLAILRRVFSELPTIGNPRVLKHVLICLVCAPVSISLDIITDLWTDSLEMDSATKRAYIRTSVLDHLGSFLVVPENSGDPIRFLHTSIVDFFVGPARPGDDPRFHVDAAEGHAHLAKLCLQHMNAKLRENILDMEFYTAIDDRFKVRSHIADIDEMQKLASALRVPDGLCYASVHWIAHLEASTPDAVLIDLLRTFALTQMLHWIELLAFLGSLLSVGHPAARKAQSWCHRYPAGSTFAPMFYDTFRFIGQFYHLLTQHPLSCHKNFIAFTPRESKLYTAYAKDAKGCIKNLRGRSQARWSGHQWTTYHELGTAVHSIAISPDGQTTASGGLFTSIRLWEVASAMPIGEPFETPFGGVNAVAFSPDGRTLVSGSYDGILRLWDVETAQEKRAPLVGHKSWVYSVAVSPDGKLLASGSCDGTIILWEAEKGWEPREPFRMTAGTVYSVAFYPDGRTLVCGCEDGSVRRWSVQTGLPVGEPMHGHSKEVWSVCVSPDGKMIASGSVDWSIQLWDARTGEKVKAPLEGHTGVVSSMAFGPDSETLASGSYDHTVRLWNARTARQNGKPLEGQLCPVTAVALTPDGKTVVSGGSRGTIQAWDVGGVEDEEERTEGHPDDVVSVAFSPDGKFVASGSLYGSMMVWSAETGLLLGKVESGYGSGELKFSVSGRLLREDGICWSTGMGWDGVVREWDVSGAVDGTGNQIRSCQPGTTEAYPELRVEELRTDSDGWVSRGGIKWLWLSEAYREHLRLNLRLEGRLTMSYPDCSLYGSTLVVHRSDVPIFNVAALL